MPRAALVSVNEAVELLVKYSEFFTDPKLPVYTSQVWIDMSQDCDSRWSPHNFYTNGTQNRRKILTLMREKLGLDDLGQSNNPLNITESSFENSRHNATSKEAHDKDPDYRLKPTFVLILENDLWKSIGPITQRYERSYEILEPNHWTDVIFDAFYSQFRLPCAFSFKRAKLHPTKSSEYYLKIEGYCRSNTCSNIFIGLLDAEPKEGASVEINIYTEDTLHQPHEIVKRYLRGRKRKRVAQDLLVQGVTGWRKNAAKDNMRLGDVEPPNLYRAHVLRLAKEEALDKKLGVDKLDGKDVVKALMKMKSDPAYNNILKDIGSDRFYVIYGLKEQKHIYIRNLYDSTKTLP